MAKKKGEPFALNLRELSGALGDLGTLLPLMLGTIAVVELAPTPRPARVRLVLYRHGSV